MIYIIICIPKRKYQDKAKIFFDFLSVFETREIQGHVPLHPLICGKMPQNFLRHEPETSSVPGWTRRPRALYGMSSSD